MSQTIPFFIYKFKILDSFYWIPFRAIIQDLLLYSFFSVILFFYDPWKYTCIQNQEKYKEKMQKDNIYTLIRQMATIVGKITEFLITKNLLISYST